MGFQSKEVLFFAFGAYHFVVEDRYFCVVFEYADAFAAAENESFMYDCRVILGL